MAITVELVGAVEDGAAELDRLAPDWWKNVDRDVLSMANGMLCVLGQQPEGYRFYEDLLDPEGVGCTSFCGCIMSHYGFCCPSAHAGTWNDLDILWTEQVMIRRAHALLAA